MAANVAFFVAEVVVSWALTRLMQRTQSQNNNTLSGMRIQQSSRGVPVTLVYGRNRISGNLIWYGDFYTATQTYSGGKGGGGGSSTTSYFCRAEMGLCEGPITGIGNVWNAKSIGNLSSMTSSKTSSLYGSIVYYGDNAQVGPSYMNINHAGQNLNYRGQAYLYMQMYTTDSGSLGNYNFEVTGLLPYNTGAGIYDALPGAIMTDLLTNTKHGVVGWTSAKIADLTQYNNYCIANGFFLSPVWMQQKPAQECITDLLRATNSDVIFSGGQIKVVPYGDTSVTGNGATFTPNMMPVYDLTDDDFIVSGNEDPVSVTRRQQSDCYNSVQIEYMDATNAYNTAIAEAKDQADIDRYGLRQTTTQKSDCITSPATARNLAQLVLQQQLYVRNLYKFKLGVSKCLLEPMDLVTITDSYLGLTRQMARIIQVDESDAGDLDVQAIQVDMGIAHAPAYAPTTNSGYAVNYNVAPAAINSPVFVVPPTQLTGGALEVWVGLSGASNFGGCTVYISTDNATYSRLNKKLGSSRTGSCLNSIPAHPDPDLVDTLNVDLTESVGTILSGTQDDADNNRTLCYLSTGELIDFATSTLIGVNQYGLSYLRRGAFGTTIGSVPGGARFVRLSPDEVFRITLDKAQIGKPFWIKCTAFNQFGQSEQAIADVTAYSYTAAMPPPPPTVTGFTVRQSSTAVVFTWAPVTDYALKGYDVYYGPSGSTLLSQMSLLTVSNMGTEMTNAGVPPGSWTFAIAARDVADQLSPTLALADLTVTNPNSTIISAEQSPGWPGTMTGFVVDNVAGALCPKSIYACSHYAVLSAPSAPTLGSAAGGALGATTYYVKISYVTQGGETLASAESSLAVAANNVLTVTSPSASGQATGYNVYVSTATGTETKQNASTISIGTGWTEPTSGLISGSAVPGSNTTGWEDFLNFCPDPVTTATYQTPEYDLNAAANLRVSATKTLVDGVGVSGSPTSEFDIDYWTTGSDPNVYYTWTVGQVQFQKIKGQVKETPGGVPAVVTQFKIVADVGQPIVQSGTAAISASGTSITLPTAFAIINAVKAVPVSNTALTVTISNITTTGFTAYLWNSSGTGVSGTINWEATGA